MAEDFADLKILGLNSWRPPAHSINAKYVDDAFGLPAAALGPNKYLSDTIDQSILNLNEGVFQILPITQNENIHIKWVHIYMDQQMSGRVPEEGVSREITSTKRVGTAKNVRRGLAILMDKDFAYSSTGQKEFMYKLRGLLRSLQNTLAFQSMSALLDAPKQHSKVDLFNGENMRALASEQIANHALVQKTDNSLDIIVARAISYMGRHNVRPDCVLLPPNMAFYLSLQRAGNQPTWKGIGQGGQRQTVQNCQIIKTDFIPVEHGDEDANPLVRNQHVAEYYDITDVAKQKPGDIDEMPAVKLYDETKDDMVEVPVRTIVDSSNTKSKMAEMFAEMQLAAAKNDKIVLIRPAITHRMGSAIVAKKGPRTGATFVAQSDFIIAENTEASCFYGNATLRSCSVVQNERNVYVAQDIFACGYVRGGGTKMYMPWSEWKKNKGIGDNYPTAEQIQEYIESADMYVARIKPSNGRQTKLDTFHLSGAFSSSDEPHATIESDFIPPEFLNYRPKLLGKTATTFDKEKYEEMWHAPGAATKKWGKAVYQSRCIVLNKEQGGVGHWAGLCTPGSAMRRSGNPGNAVRNVLTHTDFGNKDEEKKITFLEPRSEFKRPKFF